MKQPSDIPQPPTRRQTGFSVAGTLYGLTTLFLAVGAVNGQNNLLFWAFGMALGGLLVSGIFSGSGMMGLRLRRHAPPAARAGEPITIRYTVRNANRVYPLFCVTLTERLPKATAGSTPRPSVAFLPHAPPRRESFVESPATPLARGRLDLSGVNASSSFPLGLMRKSMDFDLPATLLVLPARLHLRDDLHAPPARRGHGGAASPTSVGHSPEFFGVREYIPGDNPRLIAWRASARGDTLIVRQEGTPPPTVVWVLLDIPANLTEADAEDAEPGAGEARADNTSLSLVLRTERAIALAAALIERLTNRGFSVGLMIDSLGIARTPAAGGWHARRLLNVLGALDLTRTPDAKARAANSLSRIRREHAAMIVTSGSDAADAPGPTWARRLSAVDLQSLLAPGATIPAVLMPPPPPETPAEKRRRILREFFMVDPVGEVAMGNAGIELGVARSTATADGEDAPSNGPASTSGRTPVSSPARPPAEAPR